MSVAADLIVVARRWDGLGGRLQAILNGWSLARALDLEFRFVWPRNSFRSLHEPREIFDEAFLAQFEITESTCGDRVVLPAPTHLSLPEARAFCRTAAPHSMIDAWQCFDVIRFADESAAAAETRFRGGMSEIAWSAVARDLMDCGSLAIGRGEYSAVHVRAGDIVEGDWRQFVPAEKYIPTAFVELAIETFSGPDGVAVVVASDNERYVRFLKARFDCIQDPGELVEGYTGLSEAQRAFADILVLSRARQIFGPQTSAFSKLAAHIGGINIESVGDLVTEEPARSRLRSGIARTIRRARRREVLRPLLARDICWYLDVFTDHLNLDEYLELARRASRYKPDFCGALNRLALAEAFSGNGRASAEASSRAQRAAAAAEVHEDPMVESLATSITAQVVLAFCRPPRFRRQLSKRLALTSLLRRFGGIIDRAAFLGGVEEILERCEALTPFQTDHQYVVENLRFQVAALAWLTAEDGPSREIARRAMRPARDEPLLPPSWRPSGFSVLSKPGLFSQTLRNLEIASIRIAMALGAVIAADPPDSPGMGNVDLTRTSPTGLRWAVGWAFDPDSGSSGLLVGLHSETGVVTGAPTFLARPDVEAAFDNPRALNSGFTFPMPSTVFEKADVLRAGLCISGHGEGTVDHGPP